MIAGFLEGLRRRRQIETQKIEQVPVVNQHAQSDSQAEEIDDNFWEDEHDPDSWPDPTDFGEDDDEVDLEDDWGE